MAKVKVYVTLKPTLLDAPGKVVRNALNNLGYEEVDTVRMGKYIELELKDDGRAVQERVDEMCRKLLSNPVIENYKFEILG
jgi:phosphoribosylformylglycinamidine synthase subunit PurS